MKRLKTAGLALTLSVLALSGPAHLAKAQQASPTDQEVREIPEKKSRFRAVIRNATELFDANGSGNFLGDHFENENLDILARAQARISVNTASTLPPPKQELLEQFALKALLLNDTLGALDKADAYAKMIQGQSSYQGVDAIAAIEQLEATVRTREAALLQDKFLEESKQFQLRFNAHKDDEGEKILESIRETAPLTRHCLAAIESGARAASRSDAEKLLSLYQSEVPQKGWRPPRNLNPQNLFCTVLDIARKFSDRGWCSESNELLNKLRTAAFAQKDWATAIDFILMEEIINAERTRRGGSTMDEA